jgi:hypothetical protein
VFVHDLRIKRKWIVRQKKPLVTITGSHSKTIIFGVLSNDDGKQLFRQYAQFDSYSLIAYLEQVKKKFKKFVMFVERAQHNIDQG